MVVIRCSGRLGRLDWCCLWAMYGGKPIATPPFARRAGMVLSQRKRVYPGILQLCFEVR